MDMITGWFLQWRKGAARMSRHPGVSELVMEALSTVDPVAYIRTVLVYRNFREAKVFWRVPWADRGGRQ